MWVAASALLVGVTMGLKLNLGTRQPSTNPAETLLIGEARHCDPLLQACRVGDSQSHIALQLLATPQPLKTFPVQVQAKLPDEIQTVYADLDMLNMTMASNRITLTRHGEHWLGEAILPICTSGRNDWRMAVKLLTPTATHQANFYFVVES